MRHFLILSLLTALFAWPANSRADAIDSLEAELREHPQVQEKVFIHTDNTCYYVGDTLWYRAFVLRSDNLQPTDISKILYVELVSPEGIVVQRQRLVASDRGYTHGDFVLGDSLYSGYYELRAYTRWNLNFNVSHRNYLVNDRRKFYNNQMAADYFRQWDGLYSRVVPIYAKPEEAGDYDGKYIVNRPKEDLMKPAAPALHVAFFPEGGNLVEGVRSRVAFEVTNQNGEWVDIAGQLDDGTRLATEHQGRGSFFVTPGRDRAQASFQWNGKTWTFKLPKAADEGVVVGYEPGRLTLSGRGAAAFALLCRGRLVRMERVGASDGRPISIDEAALPTGINEVVVFDAQARPVASRLFFVNHHDRSLPMTLATDKTDYAPYEPIRLTAGAQVEVPVSVSVSVRDGRTDDASFDDGNMLTDLLLSSELKGFIAYPGWYSQKDDDEHRRALDVLMMVQGWRRYKRVNRLRYTPEVALTVEGHVYKLPSFTQFTEVDQIYDASKDNSMEQLTEANLASMTSTGGVDENGQDATVADDDNWAGEGGDDGTGLGENDGAADRETEQAVNQHGNAKGILVEAELEKGTQSVGAIQKTDAQGRFLFNIPAFYGDAILFIKAYKEKDSARYAMSAGRDKHWRDERAYPEFYVKRDMFYPVFAKPYSWYQTHQPEPELALPGGFDENGGGAPANSRLAGEHQLGTVKVIASTRTRRGIAYNKPAQVLDFYSLYNLVTDYGLSFGIFEANQFPMQAATYLYGNLGMNRRINIRAMIDGTSFFRNYEHTSMEYDRLQTPTLIFDKLRIDRLDQVKIYTDYEPRLDDGMVFHVNSPSVTMLFETFPDDGKQYSYRDRRYVMQGFAAPDEFYSPDYSQRKPDNAKDYRRTLYWNPNVVIAPGKPFSATLYNNGRDTRVKVSLAGITPDGRVLLGESGK